MENSGHLPVHRLQEVYIDESYIHHHFLRDLAKLHFPEYDRCKLEKAPH